jgi:hypothetical protein
VSTLPYTKDPDIEIGYGLIARWSNCPYGRSLSREYHVIARLEKALQIREE